MVSSRLISILFLALGCYAFNYSGVQIMDLHEDISKDALNWIFENQVQTQTQTCQGTTYLTEYGMSISAKSLQRNYLNLNPHSHIYITFIFWMIDYWSFYYTVPNDQLRIFIDDIYITKYDFDTYWNPNLGCGTSRGDFGPILTTISLNHRSPTLNIKLVPVFYYDSFRTSFGISNLTILFFNQTFDSGYYASNTRYYFTLYKTPNNILTIDPCHSSCGICKGPGELNCITCNQNYYFDGSRCLKNKCPSKQYYDWNQTCVPKCAYPLIENYFQGLLMCIYPCQISQYLYWDGTCQADCKSPFTISINKGRNFCNFPCNSSALYLYPNSTCLSSCKKPYYVSKNNSRLLCLNCTANLFLMDDNTCNANCPSTSKNYTQDGLKGCQNDCGSNFVHFNGTCLSTCYSPFRNDSSSGTKMCLFPCILDQGESYFWNGSCSICSSPFRVSSLYGGSYCDFPCNLSNNEIYNYNGSCVKSCTFPFVFTNTTTGSFCKLPCNIELGEFNYPNGLCNTVCESPLKISEVQGVPSCVSPCLNSQLIYPDGSCSSTCASPYSNITKFSTSYCIFPCTASNPYYAWNGSCISDCPYPLIPRYANGSRFCDNICNLTNNYLYFNQTCGDTCLDPFINSSLTNKSCDLKCPPGQYLAYNYSCITSCPSDLISSNSTAGLYCNFICSNYSTQFLYLNGSCINSCPQPYITNYIEDRKYCNFPCNLTRMDSLSLRNNTCISHCFPPFIPRNSSGKLYCDDPCDFKNGIYYNPINKTCLTFCSFPYVSLNLSGELYCKYPCDVFKGEYFFSSNYSCNLYCILPFIRNNRSGELYCNPPCDFKNGFYFYTLNSSCLSSCPYPYIPRNVSGDLYCDFPCNLQSKQFWFENNTCSSTCSSPFIPTNYSGELYCLPPCNFTTQYYYFQNSSCLPSCPSRFESYNISTERYCSFPCNLNNQNFLFFNDTCISTCPNEYIPIVYGPEKYCDFPCNTLSKPILSDDGICYSDCPLGFNSRNVKNFLLCDFKCLNKSLFLYYNDSCLDTCPVPNKNLAIRGRKFCNKPCNYDIEYYSTILDSCTSICEFPYVSRLEYGVKYCDNPCDLSLSLTNKENCMENLLESLDSIKNATYQQVQQLSQIASDFMDETVFVNSCGEQTPYSEKIMNSTLNIIDKITEFLQQTSKENSNASTISTKNFDVYGKTESDCSLVKSTIYSSDFAPRMNLSYKDSACTNQTVKVSYFVLNSSLFDCYKNSTSKSKIFLDVTNKNGKSILTQLKATVIMAVGEECPKGCSKSITSVCICENLDILDVSSQLLSLFSNSNFSKVNFLGFANWKFWIDPAFWVIFLLVCWYVLTMILIKKKFRNKCHIRSLHHEHRPKKIEVYWVLFKAIHPLINIYVFKLKTVSKPTRATLYFFRILSMITFSSLFKTDENSTIGAFLNPYLICLPYVTFVPIVAFLTFLVSKPATRNSGENTGPYSKKFKLGMIFIALTCLVFIFGIFSISTNQEQDEKILWLIQFFKVIIQDTFISPIILFLIQLLLKRISRVPASHRPNFCQKIAYSLLDPVTIMVFKGTENIRRKINRIKSKPFTFRGDKV